ncbi:MAG TPA: hypothetical protein VFB79_02470 [Candidatus Angelobacter sp.]|nr:hypothetical protein [Candidatus Angelobacter sp.]
MNHLSEEQIVLHYYGDAEDTAGIEQHLAQCPECSAEFARLKSLLAGIEAVEVPEPAAFFEEKTWLNLREKLPEKRTGLLQRIFSAQQKWALAGVMAVLLAAAFMAGRFWPRPSPPNVAQQGTNSVNPQRVVLVAVGDHLERSQMLLVEVMNAEGKGPVNFSSEQAEARDLLDSNHLYRVSAQQAGDPQVARLLDQLGRVLAEIANSPSEISPSDLQQVRHTIQSEGLLFKVRVVGSEVNSKVRQPEQISGRNANQRL